MHSQYEEEKGLRGMESGERARLRLIEKNKNEEEDY
jgi:hypothetical protein